MFCFVFKHNSSDKTTVCKEEVKSQEMCLQTSGLKQHLSHRSEGPLLQQLSQEKLVQKNVKKCRCNVCKSFYRGLNGADELSNCIKKYQCDVCNKIFNKLTLLTEHKAIHGDKKYQCDVCDKAYTTHYGLSEHKLLHNGIMKYECCLLYTSRCV